MEVELITKEIIRPSSPTIQHLEPYKFCLFDQLLPLFYSPVVIFYPMKGESNVDTVQTITRLKNSLSETLTLLYPFSGRIKDDVFIDSFDEGVPFLEAKVNCTMSEFFEQPKLDSFNQFHPCQPYCKELDNSPLIAFQVNIFSCGGIAISVCMAHKIGDRTTAFFFIRTWFAINRKSDLNSLVSPNFSLASILFPPKNPFPEKYKPKLEKLIFQEGNSVTKRFVFNEEVITTLRQKAKAKNELQAPLPSRVVTLSCFLWKCFIAASKAVTSSPSSQSILTEAMNLRPKITAHSSDPLLGNIMRSAVAVANLEHENIELHELVKLLSDAIKEFGDNFSKNMQVENGFEYLFASLEQEDLAKRSSDMLSITSWSNIGLDDGIDFGAGRPVWFGPMGKVGPGAFNFVILIQTKKGQGIEAYITLEEKIMAVLEQDLKFLAFASLNPKIETS